MYEDDVDPASPSKFSLSRYNWAYSSTGHFMDDGRNDVYVATNTSRLTMNDSQLYTSARLSPQSLTYYGFCLLNGNYTVSLHFAEILFTNDNTTASLGRRVFDIYIQGKLVWKDFNIVDEAGGVDFIPPSEDGKKISLVLVVGIVAAVLSFILIVLGVLWWKGCFGRKNQIDEDLRGLDLQTGSFTLRQIKAATNNFDAENKIGEGGFGYFFVLFVSGATLLPADEVEALKEVANTLGKKNWNFSVDPCSGDYGWEERPPPPKGPENTVSCNCSYANNTICHVVSIVLKSQNLPGILPPELVKLPYLQQIDLTRNYLNGTIPKEWGSLPLVNISLIGNRLTGRLPIELANITTLKSFTMEYNQVSGVLPPELGNMVSIERIAIQASGLEGPIPSGISLLTKLSDMRISDIKATGAAFPPLSNMKNMKTLVLRSCNITGVIPSYLGEMTKLKNLDLSFNKLTGQIPSNFGLIAADFIYLTGNALTGPVPEGMLKKGDHVDLSYNNLTLGNSGSPICQQGNVNLFGSSTLGKNSTGVIPCLRSFKCPPKSYSFHINCGGKEVIANGSTTYEDDTDPGGASKFFLSRYNWAYSSTGNFMDDDLDNDIYIATNISRLTMNDSRLYMNARLSPQSLTYYGFCLLNGNYTVNLHFAEIMFTNDKTFYSLGRRLFDIYIQGELVWKDFNIEDEAGGADFTPPSEGRKKSKTLSPAIVVGIVLAVLSLIIILLGLLWWKGCFGQKYQIDEDPTQRPSMSSVVSMLEGQTAAQKFVSDPNISKDDSKVKGVKNHYELVQDESLNDIQNSQSMSIDVPWTGSSTSAIDLYPPDSEYWKNRDQSSP
ncbi:Leucine-rich repeat receptor-like protein kinase pepr2 [Thalictrum thalictroides]|uniref:non-specific serine/threonine protein kinase n=1 Tax=Thalictrum thalictroides TaxID=46969 RepID=A0A7J6WA82_THATH|nr:Leucine-rich repeat receptor-like protein kinase pepr2 [Thalictrum thalictroides]